MNFTVVRRSPLQESSIYWMLATSLLGFVALAASLPAVVVHPAAWRAFAGPLVLVSVEACAALLMLTSGRGWTLGVAALLLQTIAVSVGPIAYRLVAGPYVAVMSGPAGLRVGAGVDAHFLIIVGASNGVPAGIAVNLIALVGLVLLFAGRDSR